MILAGQARGEVDRAVDPDAVARVPVGIYQALARERRGLSEQEEDAHA